MNKVLVNDEGITIDEYIASFVGELHRDAVGLWQIVPAGRNEYNLSGSSLVDFIRHSIHALLDAGAIPVRGGPGSGYDWIAQKQYGAEKNAMTEEIIAEWLTMPDDPFVQVGGVWFARPNPKFPRFIKID